MWGTWRWVPRGACWRMCGACARWAPSSGCCAARAARCSVVWCARCVSVASSDARTRCASASSGTCACFASAVSSDACAAADPCARTAPAARASACCHAALAACWRALSAATCAELAALPVPCCAAASVACDAFAPLFGSVDPVWSCFVLVMMPPVLKQRSAPAPCCKCPFRRRRSCVCLRVPSALDLPPPVYRGGQCAQDTHPNLNYCLREAPASVNHDH